MSENPLSFERVDANMGDKTHNSEIEEFPLSSLSFQQSEKLTSVSVDEDPPEGKDEILLSAIKRRLRALKDDVDNYSTLTIFLVFTGVYMAVLYLQASSTKTYEVAKAHFSLLPPGYSSDSAYFFESTDDIYDWLNASIIQPIWADTKCGNGICDSPQEVAAFGPNNQFGCAADCGVFNKTVTFSYIFLTSFRSEEDQAASYWNLCMSFPIEICWTKCFHPFLPRFTKEKQTIILSRFDSNQTFQGDLVAFLEESFEILYGNWSFHLYAPNGGVDVYSYYNDTSELITIAGCTPDYPQTKYTLCRQRIKSYNESLKGEDLCLELPSQQTQILQIPQNQTQEIPTTSPEIYRTIIWDKLGSSDIDRLYRVSSAVQRALYSWVKDECLAGTETKSLSSGKNLTAFLCTFFGGPSTLLGCPYTSIFSGKILENDSQLFMEINKIHKKLALFSDQQSKFSEILIWALQSVYELDKSTIVDVYFRLRQLDGALETNSTGIGCKAADFVIPMSTSTGYPILNISKGDLVKWIWEDDEIHSLIGGNFKGFGSFPFAISRSKICTGENLVNGGFGTEPSPCNLVNPNLEPPYGFDFTHKFENNGIFGVYSDAVQDSGISYIFVSNETRKIDDTKPCSPGCSLGNIRDGKCDPSCDNPECLFDGGDCSCPLDEFGRIKCACPTGQVVGYSGACCDGFEKGFISKEFQLVPGDNNTVESINSEILPQKDATILRTTSSINKVLAGLSIQQKRRKSDTCRISSPRFSILQDKCLASESRDPFGVNPVALISSSLYDENFYHQADQIYQKNPNFKNGSLSFNGRGIPFGFYPVSLNDSYYGFQYFFDVNLARLDAELLLRYLKEGFFLDNGTSSLRINLATYNGEAHLFTLVSVDVEMDSGGRLATTADVKSISVEHYSSRTDWIRFALEIFFLLGLSINVIGEGKEFVKQYKKNLSYFTYFQSWWNILDLLSIGFMTAGAGLWIHNVLAHEEAFKVQLRYDIYESPLTSFTFWKLLEKGTEIESAVEIFKALDKLSTFRGMYMAVNGINVFLMVLRVLKLMDFQPRLGLITRTFSEAAPDLLHFFLVWAIIFGALAFYAHVVFGRLVSQFQTLDASLNACFSVVLGEDSIADYLFQLEGWELVAGVIFWWSFVIIVFFVVMNLLIAIIVEAYISVKEQIIKNNTQSLPQDIVFIFKNWLRKLSIGHFSVGQQLKVVNKLQIRKRRKSNRKKWSWSQISFGDSALARDKVLKLEKQNLNLTELISILERIEREKDQETSSSVEQITNLSCDIMDQFGESPISLTKNNLGWLEVKDKIMELEKKVSSLAFSHLRSGSGKEMIPEEQSC